MKYELIDLQESYFKTDDFEHEIMSISCEMDPPEDWVDRKINIKTGEIVE